MTVIGIKDLVRLENAIATVTMDLMFGFDDINPGTTNWESLRLYLEYARDGNSELCQVQIHGYVEAQGEEVTLADATVDLIAGMSQEDLGLFIKYRLIQILAPQGWREELGKEGTPKRCILRLDRVKA